MLVYLDKKKVMTQLQSLRDDITLNTKKDKEDHSIVLVAEILNDNLLFNTSAFKNIYEGNEWIFYSKTVIQNNYNIVHYKEKECTVSFGLLQYIRLKRCH
jgi:hypothetical protein